MKIIYKVILLVLALFCITSCSKIAPISPIEYTQLLINIKDFFTTSIFLLGSNSNFQTGQAIARLYYGHYHIARLIYNNHFGKDNNSHYYTWEKMNTRIRNYGNNLKKLRIKYDYDAQNFSNSEIKDNLKFISDNRSEFDYMIKELKGSISSFDNDKEFLKTASKEIQKIEQEYDSLVNKIKDIQNRFP